MLIHPGFDPIAVSIGPLAVRWYGLMYLLGFAAGWWLGRLRARRAGSGWTEEQVSDLLFYVALGVVLGGRVGYVLFYTQQALLDDPLLLLRVWEGGMSFHGGLLGVTVAVWLFARRHHFGLFKVTDFVAPLVTPGLFFGRIGNFINGELWGRPTDVPWGMVFSNPGAGSLPRHPSQLYEAALEGLLLFLVLWSYSSRPRPTMAVTGLFLVGYGSLRILVEFTRQPDDHLGFVALDWLSMGQLLSLPMVVLGATLMIAAYRRTEGVPR
jgi:phosphatidylglycerol:prolipoprotein diacylglycerol transferase